MKRKISSVGIVSILMIGGLFGFLNFGSENAQAPPTFVSGIVYDGSGGPWTTVGSPYIIVGNVNIPAGQTLTIEPGVQVKFDEYYRIDVDGTLHAVGTEANRIIITSNSVTPMTNDWNRIQINSIGHTEIKYCNISYSDYGIYLYSTSNNDITGNNFSWNNGNAIFLDLASNNNVSSNNLTSGSRIYLWESFNNTITDNNASNTWSGIYLVGSSNNTITSNIASNNAHGIILDVFFSSHSNDNNIIANNRISNNTQYPLALLHSSSKNIIINNNISDNMVRGIYISDSSNVNTITDNNISSNGEGIGLLSSSNNTIINNNVSNNDCSICLWASSDNNTIANNDVLNNNDGIYLSASSNNIIANNNVSNNGDGIDLGPNTYNKIIRDNYISNNDDGIEIGGTPSSNNKIYHNNIINNIRQAKDIPSTNIWNDTYPSGGNYWSDYSPTCQDLYDGAITPQTGLGGADGICDIQYDIVGGSADYYPLTNPVDITPPIITNLQPPDVSTTNENTPTISANYSDPSGIDVSSVLLKVDGIDVTLSSTVTVSGVMYIPTSALSDSIHTVYLEVKDTAGNLATVTWNFTVDTTPPAIINLKPPHNSTTNDSTPTISADYNDVSGIDLSSVKLKVDGEDVTSSAIVKSGNVAYFPGVELLDGVHDIYLEVRDTNGNLATEMWNFTVDTSSTDTPPPTTPDFIADYWWILVFLAVAIIIFVVILLLVWKKRRKRAL